ncbi:hypothetical protein BC941DRAFT_410887 [Chlamydoabsidia padenii]|nr:hypothetical protein BC941DRAFT_410887 [Chlamydoabsidia padenii]
MADQDSRDWIKQRMAVLRKKAGMAFNQDVFISILLCLVSGKNKHLILTAPSHRLHLVAQMATEICRCLFGFTTANVVCQQDQTVLDFVQGLFTSYDDDERYSTHYDLEHTKARTNKRQPPTRHDPLIQHKKSSSRLSNNTSTSSNNTASSPISPVDFTVRGGTGPNGLTTTTNNNNSNNGGTTGMHRSLVDRHTSYQTKSLPISYQQQHRPPGSSLFGDRKRFTSSALAGPPLTLSDTSMTHRLAQVLIVEQLDQANELVQAALLELIVTKEIRMTNVRYNTPKPYFLTISILPETGYHHTLSSALLDHFFISYHCKEDVFQQLSASSSSGSTPPFLNHQQDDPPPPCRRTTLLRSDEIKTLADQASKVHINIDITRYIRDIVVGVRTHPLVSGGLTARTSQDLVTVTK